MSGVSLQEEVSHMWSREVDCCRGDAVYVVCGTDPP